MAECSSCTECYSLYYVGVSSVQAAVGNSNICALLHLKKFMLLTDKSHNYRVEGLQRIFQELPD